MAWHQRCSTLYHSTVFSQTGCACLAGPWHLHSATRLTEQAHGGRSSCVKRHVYTAVCRAEIVRSQNLSFVAWHGRGNLVSSK